MINDTLKDTLARKAGLVAGDRILAANGKPVRTTLDYTAVDMFTPADRPLSLEVESKAGDHRTVILEPTMAERFQLGVTVEPEVSNGGAVIASVEPSSNNGQPVLKVGDILLSAAGIDYLDTEAFRNAVQASGGQPLDVKILRNGQAMTLNMVATHLQIALPRGIWFTTRTAFLPAVGQSFQWSWSIVKVTVQQHRRDLHR